MQKFLYNNNYTPLFPEVEGCNNMMLLKLTDSATLLWPYDITRPRYVLFISDSPKFLALSTKKQYGFAIEWEGVRHNWEAYYTIEGGSNWARFATEWPEDQVALAIANTELIWHNVEVFDLDTLQTYDKKAGEQIIDGADSAIPLSISSDLSALEGRKHQSIHFLCLPPNEMGVLKYNWHIVDNNSDGGIVGNDYYLYIPTIQVKEYQFYCLVENVVGKDYTTLASPIIQVTIEAADAIPINEKTEWLIGYLIGNALREKR